MTKMECSITDGLQYDDVYKEPRHCAFHEIDYLDSCPECDQFHEEHMRELAREIAEEQREVLIDIAGTHDV
ncbi:MAG: hypothetical protein ACR2PS_05660 [Pseudomonadales bacterium]